MEETLTFAEGKVCPVKIQGAGGGLSFSPGGDMLLVAAIPHPGPEQIAAWGGRWRAKLIQETEFPSIPIFAIGDNEDWLLETPCNPAKLEQEAPGFCEALFAKDVYEMAAVLVDTDTNLIRRIRTVVLDDIFVERLLLSWNPYRYPGVDGPNFSKAFNDTEFSRRVVEIFRAKPSKELWRTSW